MTSISRARASLAATALMLVAMAVPGCMEPAAMTCPSGIYCPAGAKCAARQAVCIFDDCGDGILQDGEACDDGNIVDGDGCSADCKSNETCGNGVVDTVMGEVCDDGNTIDGDHCSADCKSKEECGNGSVDIGEDCDGGPSGTADVAKENSVCNWNCTWSSCGDGIVNASDNEQCDDPNGNSNEGDCLTTCKWNVCGDGFLNNSNSANDTEECDEGKRNTDIPDCDYGARKQCELCSTSCKRFYGTPHFCGDGIQDAEGGEVCDDGKSNGVMSCDIYGGSCQHCTSDCSAVKIVQGPYCGDGITNGPEVCDDRNATATKDKCDYGAPFCTLCHDNCGKIEVLPGRYCGDGYVTDGETCDNYASFTCGTCGHSTCQTVPLKSATGTITVTSMVADGDSFTINDGVNNPVTFELDTNGVCVHGRICVDVKSATDTTQIAAAIGSAIVQEKTAGALVIVAVATVGGNVVALTNDTAGVSGNHDIVVSTTWGALVSGGMEGGVGCPNGGMCKDWEDCVSRACSLTGQCVSQ